AKKRISVKASQRSLRVELCCARARNSAAIGHGAGGRAVAVNTIGAGAEHHDGLPCDLLSAIESELLIASAYAAPLSHIDRDFSAGDEAYARGSAAQLAQASQQVVGGASVVPVIARVIHHHLEPECRGFGSGGFLRRAVGEHGPPAGVGKG